MLSQQENQSWHWKLQSTRMVSSNSVLSYPIYSPSFVGKVQAYLSSGFPYPENIALASLLESVVRANGGVPATVGILNGIAQVGMSAQDIVELASTAEKKTALKVSRRDLGYICGMVSRVCLVARALRDSLSSRAWQGRRSMAELRFRAQ